MKKIFLFLTLALFAGKPSFAQQTAAEALQKTLSVFDTTWQPEARAAVANKFDLIVKKWPDEWITNYYAAYAKVQRAYNEKEMATKDALLDEADTYEATATKLAGKETDELYVLRALIANGRLSADPMSRWQKYGKLFDKNLDAAKELNPDNPRVYLLQGIAKLYMPRMFGGGKKAALPYFEKAEVLFEKEPDTDPAKPYWGAQTNTFMKKQASGAEKEEK